MTTEIHPDEDPMNVAQVVLPDVPRIELPDRATLEGMYEEIQQAQRAFWDALRQFEAETELDLDSNRDFNDLSLDDVLSGKAEEGSEG